MTTTDSGVNHSPSSPDLAKLSLGTAPDSWGVWFPRDDHQVCLLYTSPSPRD